MCSLPFVVFVLYSNTLKYGSNAAKHGLRNTLNDSWTIWRTQQCPVAHQRRGKAIKCVEWVIYYNLSATFPLFPPAFCSILDFICRSREKMSAWIILRNCLNKSLDWALMNCNKLEKHSELHKGQCEKTPLLPPAAVLTKPNQTAKMCLHVYLQIKQKWSSLLSSVSRFPAWAPSGPPRATDPGCHGLLGWTILSVSVSEHKPVPGQEDRGRSGLNSDISLY